MLRSMDDAKAVVRRGYDLTSRAYRTDDAGEGVYRKWLDLLEKNWLGVEGGDVWWSHADSETYRRWITEAGMTVEHEAFVPEGSRGHTFILATC